ncbi:diguanylate cyclase [Bacillus sp. RD4P76]|uniref:Diguanylate cyclase n=2 Tax=Bacillus suaedaesalsae TaxID=2810349 RepID=A0ABS2DKX6_9BACI|nr:diguanylate cyclase [Bacillus suaedaesalsae]MBM6619149.1 diguanylate cyclase [Bacillus suaedaesalsae]
MTTLKLNHIYVAFISILGMTLFIINLDYQVNSLMSWVLIYTLTGAVILLNHFIIVLIPSGNGLSMDSSIYLACIFIFGIEIPLLVLLASSVIYLIVRYKINWWKHFFNFGMYSLTIIASYFTFIYTGGEIGAVDIKNLAPYAISLSVYFLLNVVIIWLFFFFSSPQPLFSAIKGVVNKGILKESIMSYLSTLMLSLVLTILMSVELFFGLFLYTILSVLLSFAFTKFFNLYKGLEEKASRDFLTSLYNHGYFKLRLEGLMPSVEDRSEPFSVALLDIDDFSRYNDMNGHLQGDVLLKYFGEFLKDRAAKKDYIVARYGGEEFGILMPGTSRSEAFLFLNKLRKKLNDTYIFGAEDLPLECISFSGGIVEYEKGIMDSTELLKKADKALYYAKAQGKNNIQIYNETNDVYQDDLQIFKDVESLEQQLQIFLSKDMYTYQHSKRVFRYAADLSEKLHLTESEKRSLILGALIHDIGKLEIPRDVINKKGALDHHEWEMMKKHVTFGKEIVASTKRYDELLPLIELHHERFDGRGYPYGLAGESIPKLARILCVIDSFDAMTTERPYQATRSFEDAIEELRDCSGKQFDPQFVEPFIEMIEEKYPDRLTDYEDTTANLLS